ncbi:MAG: hypothetical protein LBL92_02570, partial [Propionibacteriaceae bacterium]|nr:hypothetical protein [Propionibacteriaceae bacterium]
MGDFVIKINERNVSGELLLNDLQEVADELNQDTVSAVQYNELGRYSSTTLIRRFGSWFAALERAGLKMSRTRMNLTEDELFNNIKDVWMSLGRQPKYSEVRAPLSLYSVSTYDKRFGGWNN